MTDLAYASPGADEHAPVRGVRAVAIVVAALVGFVSFYTLWQDGIRPGRGREWVMFLRGTDLVLATSALATAVFLWAQHRDWRLSRLARLAPFVWIIIGILTPLGDLVFLSLNAMKLIELRNLPRLVPAGLWGVVAPLLRDCAAIVVPIIAFRLLTSRPVGTGLRRAFIGLGAIATIGALLVLVEPQFFKFMIRTEMASRKLPVGFYTLIVVETWALRGLFVAMAVLVVGAALYLCGMSSVVLRVGLIGMIGCLLINWGAEISGKSWEFATGRALFGSGTTDFDDWLRTVAIGMGLIAQRGGWAVAVLLLLRGATARQTRFVFPRNQAAMSSSDNSPAARER